MTKRKSNPKKNPYPVEVRKKAVSDYLNGHINQREIVKGVGCSIGALRRWVSDYKKYGDSIFSEEGSYFIYKHTVPNGKVYIGQTKQRPETRWRNGMGYSNSIYFSQAIQKYGWENIEHEILYSGLTMDEADKIEKELITKYKSNDKNYGYNILEGGNSGYIVTDETKQRLRDFNLGKAHPISDEARIKIGIAKGHPVKQFTLDGEYIETFYSASDAARNMGKPSSQGAHIVACCNGARNKAYGFKWCWDEDDVPIDRGNTYPQSRQVAQFSLEGEFIAVYESLKDAGKAVSCAESAGDNIQVCCKGRTKTAYGYQWKYIENDLIPKVGKLRIPVSYGEIKAYLENHSYKETANHFDINYHTFHSKLRKAKENNSKDDDTF